ncbi:MAG TPA: S16 family serine protease [Actinomycetota bacterium]|nr:S16 family serine protease [Actinomycetota bacterium]
MPPHDRVPKLVLIVPVLTAVLALLNMSVPRVWIGPGSAVEVKELVRISGAQEYRTPGKLLLTTVHLVYPPSLAMAIKGWLDPLVDLPPSELYYPEDVDPQEVNRGARQDLQNSKLVASAAALTRLGYPVVLEGADVLVSGIPAQSPATGVLRRGDFILAVGGHRVCGAEELRFEMSQATPGEPVALQVRRDGRDINVTAGTVPDPENERRAVLGVELAPQGQVRIQLPFKVEIEQGDIGGPSAGLVFALSITDLLQDGDLSGGRAVAGTGTIGCGGQVGLVGGVKQKVTAAEKSGAELFLVPQDEFEDACKWAKRIRIVPVNRLDEAVRVLQDPAAAKARSCR